MEVTADLIQSAADAYRKRIAETQQDINEHINKLEVLRVQLVKDQGGLETLELIGQFLCQPNPAPQAQAPLPQNVVPFGERPANLGG